MLLRNHLSFMNMGKVTATSQRRDAMVMLSIQGVVIALLAVYGKYDGEADATKHVAKNATSESSSLGQYYPMFQDVHVMIYIGFGFLMTFLKKYSYSATGFTLLLGAMLVQWAILCHGFFHLDAADHKMHVGIESLLSADIAAAAVLISMGAVLGKTTPLQLIVMGVIEVVAYTANEYIGLNIFKAVDAGGSMFVHVFGAYFGLAVSMMMQHGKVLAAESGGGESNEGASYNSDTFAMIGSIFLWLFWPSFNAGLCVGDERHRAVVNTYLSLSSCCVAAFATSAFLSKDHKFNMVHIQNSTLAGGVAIGTVANMMVYPYGALLIGTAAGVLSVFGYHHIQPMLLRNIKLHDTCGVHYLHGMPGVLSGLIGVVVAGTATEKDYSYSLYKLFPARMPPNSTPEYFEYMSHLGPMEPGEGRSGALQAGYQMLALCCSILFAVISGIITGVILKPQLVADLPQECYFDDELYWDIPEDDTTSSVHHRESRGKNSMLDITPDNKAITSLDISVNNQSSL